MGSSRGNKGRRVGEFNLIFGESHCEPVKKLGFIIDTGEVISEAESKYREKEPLFKSYQQLNDETSLEWFCSDDLIKRYEKWDCKNLEKYKPSKAEIGQAKAMIKMNKNLPTNGLLKASKELRGKNSPYDKLRLIEKARLGTPEYINSIKNLPHQRALEQIKNTPMEKLKRAMENTSAGISKRHIDEQKKRDEMLYPHKRFETEIEKLTQAGLAKQQEMKAMQAEAFGMPPLVELRALQALHNSPITPAYINSAEIALKALGGHSALSDMIASIKPYQSEIDSILSRGIDAQIARTMYGTHSELLEQFRNLKPPKKQKKNKKYWKQKAKDIGGKKAKELKEREKAHNKELKAKDEAHAKKIEELEKENRLMLLSMANGTGQNTPEIEPNWEAGRPKDTEPACFITFSLETYWHSRNDDGEKRGKIPDDTELRRWLIAHRNSDFKIEVVSGYFIKIDTKGYHIDNTAIPEKDVSFKSFTKSFDTVLTKINENMTNLK